MALYANTKESHKGIQIECKTRGVAIVGYDGDVIVVRDKAQMQSLLDCLRGVSLSKGWYVK